MDTRGLPAKWWTFADYGHASIILYYFQSIDCIETSGLGWLGGLWKGGTGTPLGIFGHSDFGQAFSEQVICYQVKRGLYFRCVLFATSSCLPMYIVKKSATDSA